VTIAGGCGAASCARAGNANAAAYYPGDDDVDLVGFTALSSEAFDGPTGMEGQQSFAQLMAEKYGRARAFGKPVVARGVAAVPETVRDAALLIGEHDGALVAAEAMYEVLTNEPLRADLVERGHRRAEQYNPDRSRAILLDNLRRLG